MYGLEKNVHKYIFLLRICDSVIFNHFHVGEQIFYIITEKQSSSPLNSLMVHSHQNKIGNRLASDWLPSHFKTGKMQLGYIGITWFHSHQLFIFFFF